MNDVLFSFSLWVFDDKLSHRTHRKEHRFWSLTSHVQVFTFPVTGLVILSMIVDFYWTSVFLSITWELYYLPCRGVTFRDNLRKHLTSFFTHVRCSTKQSYHCSLLLLLPYRTMVSSEDTFVELFAPNWMAPYTVHWVLISGLIVSPSAPSLLGYQLSIPMSINKKWQLLLLAVRLLPTNFLLHICLELYVQWNK